MDAKRSSSIRAIATRLLRDAWLNDRLHVEDHQALRKFLLDFPYCLARELGYSVLAVRSDYFVAASKIRTFAANQVAFVDSRSKLIILRRAKPEQQRVSLLHELGHVILGHTPGTASKELLFRAVGATSSTVEREADRFAVEIAVPEKYLSKVFAKTIGDPILCDGSDTRVSSIAAHLGVSTPDLNNVRSVAGIVSRAVSMNGVAHFQDLISRFFVSESLMSRRLIELGLVRPKLCPNSAREDFQFSDQKRGKCPRLVVFCSKESLAVARAVQQALRQDLVVTLWTDNLFRPGKTPISNIRSAVENTEFVLAILGPDDRVEFRGESASVTRDNVVLELGIAYGQLGEERTFFAQPLSALDFRIPTNLVGPEPLRYDSSILHTNDISAVVGIAYHFRQLVAESKQM